MIEAKIDALIDALNANTLALTSGNAGKAAAHPPATAQAPAAPTKEHSTSAALDYEKDVKPLALRVAKDKGRDALVGVLGTFKVAQANLLKPEQYPAFIKACNAAITA